MRILVDAVAGRTGAGATYIDEFATAFPRLRPQHEYLFVVRPEMVERVTRASPELRTLVPPPGFRRPPARLAWEHAWLPRRPLPWRPDVVLAMFNVLPLGWRAPRPRTAVLVTNLAPYSPDLRRMYAGLPRLRLALLRRLTDRSLSAADRVFLVSNHALDLIGLPGLAAKARVVPVAPPPLPANVGRDAGAPDEPYAVVVGDLFRYKGVEVVSRALAAMEPAERPLVLVCGRRPDPSYSTGLDREIAARGVGDRVRFLGSVERDRVLRLLAGSLACIVPSRFENKSYVPIEAMAVGAPVLAADIPPTHESCGNAARYFDPDRPGELAEHLRALLADPATGRRMAEAGRARVAPMRPTDAAEPILETLEELVR